MLLLWNVYLLVFFDGCQRLHAWSYKGAAAWHYEYPACGGNDQSPINLDYKLSNEIEIKEETIQFTGMEKVPKSAVSSNDGHKLLIIPEWNETAPGVSGGPLKGNYIFDRMLIRWPNEHTAYGESLPLAVHLVYYNENFESWTEALGQRNGVAEVVHSFTIKKEKSEVFKLILNNTDNVLSTPNDQAPITPFPLSIMKSTTSYNQYLTYDGSLSYPPCYGPVTWLLADNLYGISQDQIDKITSTQLFDGDTNNARPTQPLRNRLGSLYTVDLYKNIFKTYVHLLSRINISFFPATLNISSNN